MDLVLRVGKLVLCLRSRETRERSQMESRVKIEDDASSDDGWNDGLSDSDPSTVAESGGSSPVPAEPRPLPGDPGRLPSHLLNIASTMVANMNRPYQSKSKESCPSIDVSSFPPAPPPPPVSPNSESNPFFGPCITTSVPNPFTWTQGCSPSSNCAPSSGQNAPSVADIFKAASSVAERCGPSSCGPASSTCGPASSCGPSPSSSGPSLNDIFGLLSGQQQGGQTNLNDVVKLVTPFISSFLSNSSSAREEKKESSRLTATMMACLGDCAASTQGIVDPTMQAYVFVDKLFCCYKLMSTMARSEYKGDPLYDFALNSMEKSLNQQFTNALKQLSSNGQDYAD